MVTLTERAAFRLRAFLRGKSGENAEKGIRLAVTSGGCSGYQYAMSLVDSRTVDDVVVEQEKVRLYIDAPSAQLLNGVVIDYVEGLTESGFRFTNPNAAGTCGCGQSFRADECSPSGAPCRPSTV